ncbi:type I restriction endonuclease subunit R [bacterium]|nr:type I restriction endonuclease subunit R [bacterium]
MNEDLLKKSLKKINYLYHDDAIFEQAINKIKRIDNPSLFEKNHTFHNMLINGINVDQKDAKINPLIKFIDFENIENNTFQIYHQIPYQESRGRRIPDVVLYINGIPLIVMELKSFDELATNNTLEYDAYRQLGGNSENNGYRYDIPKLFTYNSFLVISDGINTKVGTLTSKFNRYYE